MADRLIRLIWKLAVATVVLTLVGILFVFLVRPRNI